MRRKRKKEVKKVFFNQATLHIMCDKLVNVKIFNNGTIQMTGLKSIKQGKEVVNLYIDQLKKHNENIYEGEISVLSFNVVLINSDFDIKYKVNRELLHRDILAKDIEKDYNINISEIWSVGSSGTLTRGLQMAFPDKDVNVVSVGHKMRQHEIGRAKLYLTKYKFMQEVKEEDKPPFPSVPTYDAKAWSIMKKYAKKGSLFWNVGK